MLSRLLLNYRLNCLLDKVQRPGRYIGSELNAAKKDWRKVSVRFALAYPELYEIGMSSTGFALLYELLNQDPAISCERVFMPELDYAKLLREKRIPLTTLESRKPLKDFDFVGFSLAYELTYTNALSMLSFGGIPLLSKDRSNLTPLVIGGGEATVNPEPIADFFDLFIIGDGEEALPEVIRRFIDFKKSSKRKGKEAFLRSLLDIKGVYIPRFYKRSGAGSIEPAASEAPQYIEKATLRDIKNSFFPVKPVVPFVKTVHERATVEIMRGCPRRCKFCQARV
ncbi:MAG: B12-binding domain-containing radical SAM protein, partial [Candidatus Omnitrophica bacterium]|nr:B12-binding domain-containing radical SAM protein [Candidatus Omnitrophota bacterium]